MNMHYISYACITALLSGCLANAPHRAGAPEQVMPRYISPAKYAGYSCDELNASIAELIRAREYISSKVHQGNTSSDHVYKWTHKVEVGHNDATIDRYGLFVVYGHLQGACRLATSRDCLNMQLSACAQK